MNADALVIVERREKIAVLRLNRPDKLNAINRALLEALTRALSDVVADPRVAVVLLTGAGRAFCAGDDLDEFLAGHDGEWERGFIDLLQDVTRLIMLSDKPVVCAAHGFAVGAGASWVVNADVALAADDMELYCPEASYGLLVTGGASMLFAERCGPARAAEILYLGQRVRGEGLIADRLVTRLAPAAQLESAALSVAAAIAALPSAARTKLKQARARDLSDRLEAALAFERQSCLDIAETARVERSSAIRARRPQ